MRVAKFLILAAVAFTFFACKSTKVLVQFDVEGNGNITNMQIIQSSGNPAIDAEAFRVVQMMKWKPQNDSIHTFILPVKFKLSKKGQSDSTQNQQKIFQ